MTLVSKFSTLRAYHINDGHERIFLPVTADAIFSGITTFAKLPWVKCLTKEKDVPFDIAFLGAPFVSSRHIPTHLKMK